MRCCPVPVPVLTGALSGGEFLRRFRGQTLGLPERIAADLSQRLTARSHMTDTHRRLVTQMIEAAPLTAPEVMAQGRDPARIVTAMLGRQFDPARKTAPVQQAFRDVVEPMLTHWLADPAFCDHLRPAYEAALAASMERLKDRIDQLVAAGQNDTRRPRPCAGGAGGVRGGAGGGQYLAASDTLLARIDALSG